MEQLKKLRVAKDEDAWAAAAPVSPSGQYFNSSAMRVGILGVLESEVPIDDSRTTEGIVNDFLPVNPRFTSVMVRDDHGVLRWKKVKVVAEDHVSRPVFPPGLPFYDDYVQDYLSDVALREFPQSQPLWEIHIIKYPTSEGAAGFLVFKLHHALGDGFSIMGALFSCIRRADDPSLPLTFPGASSGAAAKPAGGVFGRLLWVPRMLWVCGNTVRDFSWSLWNSSSLGKDDVTPVRSGQPGAEFRPITISSVDFSLEEIRKVKERLGGTVNDVMCGVIFYAIRLYIQAMSADKGGSSSSSSSSSKVTALVLLNTRMLGSNYQHLQEMVKQDSKTPWGNHIAFLHVSVPECKNLEEQDPLKFVHIARKTILAKKNSLAVYLIEYLLEFMRKVKGPEAVARYIHKTLSNTSMTIANLVGPKEQMLMAGHVVRSFHFTTIGGPENLTITMVSYIGKLKVTFKGEKGFIDTKFLASKVQESFERILQAAFSKEA